MDTRLVPPGEEGVAYQSPEEFENRRRNRASFVHYILNHSEKLDW